MYKIKENFSNFIIFFFIILFFLTFLFGIIKFNSFPNWGIKIIIFSSLTIIFFTFVFFLKKKIKDYIISIITTAYVAFLFVNVYLEIIIPNTNTNAAKLAQEAGVDFDNRSKIEVIYDLRKKNIETHPSTYTGLLQTDVPPEIILQNNLYPLGGISNVTTVMCNESGFYTIYLSDKFGFNNDNIFYQKNNKIMIVGDSMVHGYCVHPGEDIAGYLRSKGFNTFSFGIASNGPLTELATIREYAGYLKPKIILWFYHPNDFYDLHREIKTPILKNYLKEDFYQNLIGKQKIIDNFLKKITEEQLIKGKEKEDKKQINVNLNFLRNIRNYLTLHNLRFFLNISSATSDYDKFEQIMFLAKKEVNKINATLYFVYLPDMRELKISKNNTAIDNILNKHDIESLNFTKILKETDDPLSFFPWRKMIHFNKNGYALLGDAIIEKILNNSDF